MSRNHEPIITDPEFALVQRLLGLDTRTSPNEEKVYPLSGLAVCGDCGALIEISKNQHFLVDINIVAK